MNLISLLLINSIKFNKPYLLTAFYVPPPPIISICFLAGTPVLTDQGHIAIEKINTKTIKVSSSRYP